MKTLLLVAMGGALGAVSRFLLSQAMAKGLDEPLFPWPILTVNLLGCFAIGIATEIGELRGLLHKDTQLILLAGFLGSFTTFSTFGYETHFLIRSGARILAGAYIAASVIGGIIAVHLGTRLIARLA